MEKRERPRQRRVCSDLIAKLEKGIPKDELLAAIRMEKLCCYRYRELDVTSSEARMGVRQLILLDYAVMQF